MQSYYRKTWEASLNCMENNINNMILSIITAL